MMPLVSDQIPNVRDESGVTCDESLESDEADAGVGDLEEGDKGSLPA